MTTRGTNPNRSRNSPHRAPGKIYPRVRRANERKELDRGTWAGTQLLIVTYDTFGVGEIETELIDFGVVFDGVPFFAYGVETLPDQILTVGDFPLVTVGVRSWHTTEADEDSQAKLFYLGAFLWISIGATTTYRLRFRLSFEGTTMRNVEYFRGLNG